MKNKFNVGDRVRCIAYSSDDPAEARQFIGRHGVVLRAISEAGYLRVSIANSERDSTLFKPEELELI